MKVFISIFTRIKLLFKTRSNHKVIKNWCGLVRLLAYEELKVICISALKLKVLCRGCIKTFELESYCFIDRLFEYQHYKIM